MNVLLRIFVRRFTADNQLGSDLRASLLLSRQAYHRHHTAAAESSVFSALEEAGSSGVHKILNADKGAVASVAFSPDGSILAAGTLRDTLLLWNVRTNEWQSLPVSDNSVVSVAFSGDGSCLATGLQHGGVLVWDTRAKK